MGYNNRFSLKIHGQTFKEIDGMKCPNCNRYYSLGTSFCQDDGNKLLRDIRKEEISDYDIISEFREFSEEGEAYLQNDGNSNDSGSGHNIKGELEEFSLKYDKAVFQFDIRWDNGYGDEASEPSRYFIKCGKTQECITTLVFDEYDENKLK